jgi:hypothetical protein
MERVFSGMDETLITSDDFLSLARDILAAGHSLRFRARGRSMTPFVHDGDILTIAPAAGQDLRAGDIAFYAAGGGKLVAHRVLRRWQHDGGLVLLTRGDASAGDGERVAAAQVLGRAVSVHRRDREVRLDTFGRRASALAAIHLFRFARAVRRAGSRVVRTIRRA